MKDKNENKNQDKRKDYFDNDSDNPQQLPLIIEEIHGLVGKTKKNIFKIGKLLTEAKALVGHGNFQDWIEDNFDFSYQTAKNFMNVYDYCLERPYLVETIKSSVLYTIASPRFPKDLREHLFEYGDGLSDIKHSQIIDIMQRFKKKKINFESPEIKGLIQYREDYKNYKNYEEEIDHCLGQLRQLEKVVANMSTGISWPTVLEKDKLEMTEKQMGTLEGIKKDIAEALDAVFPQAKLVKIIKPSLKKIIKQQKLPSMKKQKSKF